MGIADDPEAQARTKVFEGELQKEGWTINAGIGPTELIVEVK